MFAVSVFFFFSFQTFAQDLTGIWKGYFITDGGEQYKLEFQVRQDKASLITGVSYSYLDVRFYGKATMTGSINLADKRFQVQELRTVEVKNMSGGGTCLMKYIFTYAKSGKEEFLEGTFAGKSEDRKNPKNDGEWGDCGGGKVYLRRVESSDFYVEPFLRDKPKHTPDVTTSAPPDKPVKKPVDIAVKKTPPNNGTAGRNTKPKNNAVARNHPVIRKPKPVIVNPATTIPDSGKTTASPTTRTATAKVVTPDVLRTRENALAKTIVVNSNQVSIRLYDNGEIDGDSISVFVDKKLLLSHKGLSTVPITLTLNFDADNTEHEVVMVAENLGRIPPNTSLMIINAGDKRYQVQITSTEQKNAMVRFRYENPTP